jgi:hypothetical protein
VPHLFDVHQEIDAEGKAHAAVVSLAQDLLQDSEPETLAL